MDNNVPPIQNSPPPVIVPPVQTVTVRRGGRGWMVIALILALLLVFSMAGNFFKISYHFLPSATKTGAQSGHRFEEVTVENNSSGNKIAIVDLEGLITSQSIRGGRNMVDLISDQLKVAGKDENVKAVILKVDSPGGEVMASDDIARAIDDFQKNYSKPVISAMGSLAASGGYYVSAPCQWIVANELTLTGSIGVIMHGFNYRGLLDKVGVVPQVFKSGKFKDMLSGTKKPEEIDPAEEKMIQDMIMETYAKFKKVVADGRGRAQTKNQGSGKSLSKDWESYADGRVLTGKQALDLGFVDELGNFATAVERAKKLTKLSDANLIRYEEPFDITHLFNIFGESGSSGKAVKLDLGLDVPHLQAGRPYFLSPTLVK